MKFVIAFAELFSKPVFNHARVLLAGAILSPATRTVTNDLRVMGFSEEKNFQLFHRVLNRAVWSPLAASRILLDLLIKVFGGSGELVIGFDDTIERRRGKRIRAKGIYRWVLIRDPGKKFAPQALQGAKRHLVKLSNGSSKRQVEVTFEESRGHLGIETECQWSDIGKRVRDDKNTVHIWNV